MANWRVTEPRLAKRQEIFSDDERCSHCCAPIPKGGSKHGQGTYCRTCIRSHFNSVRWHELATCRHCQREP